MKGCAPQCWHFLDLANMTLNSLLHFLHALELTGRPRISDGGPLRSGMPISDMVMAVERLKIDEQYRQTSGGLLIGHVWFTKVQGSQIRSSPFIPFSEALLSFKRYVRGEYLVIIHHALSVLSVHCTASSPERCERRQMLVSH